MIAVREVQPNGKLIDIERYHPLDIERTRIIDSAIERAKTLHTETGNRVAVVETGYAQLDVHYDSNDAA